jgi:hypothetical protein
MTTADTKYQIHRSHASRFKHRYHCHIVKFKYLSRAPTVFWTEDLGQSILTGTSVGENAAPSLSAENYDMAAAVAMPDAKEGSSVMAEEGEPAGRSSKHMRKSCCSAPSFEPCAPHNMALLQLKFHAPFHNKHACMLARLLLHQQGTLDLVMPSLC